MSADMYARTPKIGPGARSALLVAVVAGAALCAPLTALPASEEVHASARQALVRVIESDVRRTSRFLDKAELDSRVMRVMGKVPRHEFVPDYLVDRAYENRPLPIGYGQTISQPYIVAIMTDLLALPADCKVLEVGTGSGYQAAVLAELCAEVFTIEVVEPLGIEAGRRLGRLGYENVTTRLGDGYYGWPEKGPFDAIIVTAVASHLPPPLLEQLRPGGKLIIPVGGQFTTQQLVLVEKSTESRISTRQILPVLFVPLTGGHDQP